jgi:hypothetical protein
LPRNLDGLYQLLLWSGGGAPGRGELRGLDGKVLGEVLPEDSLGERIRALGLKPSQIGVSPEWHEVKEHVFYLGEEFRA